MDLGIVSMRYAKAFLRFAIQNSEDAQVYAETSALAQAFLEVPALQKAMLNPVLTNSQKVKLLLAAACGEKQPSKSLERFMTLVIQKQRADAMMLIAHSYGTLYRKEKQIIKGKLVVSGVVNEQVVAKLQQIVEAKSKSKVDFQVVEDATIGGGFILEYDTYRLDASVRNQLARLQRELAK